MPEFGLLGAFAMGLLGGVHCVGMCGGIVGAISLAAPGAQPQRFWSRQLGYNLGRISSYAIAGLLVGGLGSLLASASGFYGAQRLLMALAGAYLMAVGVGTLLKTGNVKAALLAPVATLVQFAVYGLGFLKSTILLTFSRKKPEDLFPRLFFKP